jgi:catalase
MMDDHDHPELDFDPLDDTKVWPEDQFPPKPVGRMVLDRNASNFFAENEQIAFGTGVLVDGLDFSDDKMLVGRTFSYSDTQRYRVGPNYLQLPVNHPRNAKVSTNQRDGQMAYYVDNPGENPHVNYEPSITGGLREAQYPTHDEQGPVVEGRLTRKRIPRTNDYQQAGERYLLSEQWEKDDLVANLTGLLAQCDRPIQERMVWHLYLCEDELGQRVGDGLGISADDVRGLPPLQSQTLTEAELERARTIGSNPPREVDGNVMTHCVPNERVAIAADEDLVGAS